MCPMCMSSFTCRQGVYQHKKRCKKRLGTAPIYTPTPTHVTHSTINSITNNDHSITNNNIQHHTHNTHIVVNFGNEDISQLLSSTDPRIPIAFKSITNAVDLVHFNRDFPENQTIRKLVKKDNLMELRRDDQWETVLCSAGLVMIRDSICKKLNGQSFTDNMSYSEFRDSLYAKSKRGNVSTEKVLANVNLPEEAAMIDTDPNVYRCFKECDEMINKEVNGMYLATLSLPNTHGTLTKAVNAIRERYGFEPMDIQTVIDKWLNPIYSKNKRAGNERVKST